MLIISVVLIFKVNFKGTKLKNYFVPASQMRGLAAFLCFISL